MATIKLQPSGAVVLKDGKVSCACCATACCPYPAQALVDGLYTYQDLPDAIDIDSIEFTKLDPPQFIGGVNQYYINTDGEYVGIESMPSDSVWAYEGGNNACLLNDTGWEDQFANSYTITYPPTSTSVVVTRISLCVWRGNDACGRPWYLMYGDQEPFVAGNPYSWHIWMAIDEGDPCGDFQQPIASKTGLQNTPVGSYLGNNNGTVS
jgi:hypothetical protein